MKYWITSLLALVAFSSGCANHLYSPSARMSPLEVPETLDAGESSVDVQAAVGGQLLGVSVLRAGARYGRGLSDELEVGGEFNVASLSANDEDYELAEDHHPNIYTSRLSLKWAPELFGGNMSFVGGFGGGASAAGGFVSPDAGVILGWQNPIVTPFLSTSVFFSQPIAARELDVRDKEDTAPVLKKPEFTYGYSATLGLRVPVDEVDIMTGVSFDHLEDDEKWGRFVSLHLGVRGRFE